MMKKTIIVCVTISLSALAFMSVVAGADHAPAVENMDVEFEGAFYHANLTANIIDREIMPQEAVSARTGGVDAECPPEGIDEGEPCGEDINGGCNSDPAVFTDASCGEIFCGESWYENDTRDTDWYEIVLTEVTNAEWRVEAEFDAVIGIVETVPVGSDDCADSTGYLNPYELILPNSYEGLEAMLEPGTYWLFVAPNFEGPELPCSEGPWDYYVTLDCEPCFDNDGDGYYDIACEGTDCDDGNPEVYPGADEVCNGVDDDCDGLVPAVEADEDMDSWRICDGDCDDGEAAANPGLVESGDLGNCGDGIDNDCDSLVDSDAECGGCFVDVLM
ncbi:putative metal-binding motif-containing protein [Thermodesulfobacteriota bacterium]